MTTTAHRTPPLSTDRISARDLRVEAYVREDLPGASDRVSAVLDRLTRLDDGDVESVSVIEWTNSSLDRSSVSLPLSRSAVRETVEEFGEWAARRNRSLAPAFDRPADGGTELLRVPIVGLAVYDADDTDDGGTEDGDANDGKDLLAVFPYTDRNGEFRTVEDGLTALEGGT